MHASLPPIGTHTCDLQGDIESVSVSVMFISQASHLPHMPLQTIEFQRHSDQLSVCKCHKPLRLYAIRLNRFKNAEIWKPVQHFRIFLSVLSFISFQWVTKPVWNVDISTDWMNSYNSAFVYCVPLVSRPRSFCIWSEQWTFDLTYDWNNSEGKKSSWSAWQSVNHPWFWVRNARGITW